jgi:serine/threonine protein kinase
VSLDEFEDLIDAADGTRSDYALERAPLNDEGGQGQVFRATHKPTGTSVAFKKLRFDTDDGVARMRREIRIGRKLRDQAHVVPVLDWDRDHRWFVMPLAEGSLVDNRAHVSASSKTLRRLLEQLVSALAAAHELGWVHRDIKPANVLLVEHGHWALGDWGLVRGPRGQTTLPNRTRMGQSYGTVGFAAPELSNDAHAATFAADIYSLGQIIGWALVGQEPHANVPLLPSTEPWRGVAKAATRFDAAQRPQSCDAFLALLASELDEPPEVPANAGEALLAELHGGDSSLCTASGPSLRAILTTTTCTSTCSRSSPMTRSSRRSVATGPRPWRSLKPWPATSVGTGTTATSSGRTL